MSLLPPAAATCPLQRQQLDFKHQPTIPRSFVAQHLLEIAELEHNEAQQVVVELVLLGPGEVDINPLNPPQRKVLQDAMVSWPAAL